MPTKKKTPALTHKILVQDACATAKCVRRPVKGSEYCRTHKELAAAAEAKLDALDVANKARAKAVQKDARPALATLIAKGWTLRALADALGTSPGRVWFWNAGKPCRRIADIQSLVFRPVPRRGVVDHTGQRKAPRAPLAAKTSRPKVDERQLLLALSNAISTYLAK